MQAQFYEKPGTNICAAFLTNTNSRVPATVSFRGQAYYLPARSISILPDCKTVVLNTQTVTPHLILASIYIIAGARNWEKKKKIFCYCSLFLGLGIDTIWIWRSV